MEQPLARQYGRVHRTDAGYHALSPATLHDRRAVGWVLERPAHALVRLCGGRVAPFGPAIRSSRTIAGA